MSLSISGVFPSLNSARSHCPPKPKGTLAKLAACFRAIRESSEDSRTDEPYRVGLLERLNLLEAQTETTSSSESTSTATTSDSASASVSHADSPESTTYDTPKIPIETQERIDHFAVETAAPFIRALRSSTKCGISFDEETYIEVCKFVERNRAKWEANNIPVRIEYQGRIIIYTPTLRGQWYHEEGYDFHRRGIITVLLAAKIDSGAFKELDIEVKMPDYRKHYHNDVHLIATLRMQKVNSLLVQEANLFEVKLFEKIESTHFHGVLLGFPHNSMTPKLYSIQSDTNANTHTMRMHFCSRGSYYHHIDSSQLNRDHLVHHATQCIDRCIELHNMGIVHLDLKPENFLMDQGERLHLTDFGHSLYRNAILHGQRGTNGYISPEVAKNRRYVTKVDPKMDVWSLGATLYFALYNQDLWQMLDIKSETHFQDWLEVTPYSLVQKRLNTLFTRLHENASSLSPANRRLLSLIQQMLTIDPIERISMSEARAFLQSSNSTTT